MQFQSGLRFERLLGVVVPKILLASLLALLATIAVSCSDNQKKPESKKDKGVAESGDATNDDGGTPGEDIVDNGGDFVDDDEPADGEVTSIEELLKQCGGDGIADADPDEVVYEKSVKSLEITKNFYIVKVMAQSELDIKVTGAETKQTTKVEIETKTALTFIGDLASSFIEDMKKKNSGSTTYTNVPFSEYSALGSDHSAWEGVLCTFVPATKVVNERGGYETIVEFDPPLPSSVSPRADAKRYVEEIGDKRVFKKIKAIVKQSDNPALDGADEIVGEVRVEKVKANTEVTPEGGEPYKIKADLAYKVTYDFGDTATTYAMGLPPEVIYYISNKDRDLVANVVDTKDSTTGIVTFVHKD